MHTIDVEDIKAFIPSKDYEASKHFYRGLGFEAVMESDEVTEFRKGECSFILQNYYNADYAKNCMLQMVVNSITSVQTLLRQGELAGVKFKEPEHLPWGKVMYLWGPAGELWQITEFD